MLNHFPHGHSYLPIGFVGHPTFILQRMLTLNCGSISQSLQARKSSLWHCHPSCPWLWTQPRSFPCHPFSCTMNSLRTLVQPGKKKKNKKNAAQQLYWSTREASTERDRKGWWRKERQEQMEQSRLLQCPCTHQVLTRKPVGSVKEAPLTSVGSG